MFELVLVKTCVLHQFSKFIYENSEIPVDGRFGTGTGAKPQFSPVFVPVRTQSMKLVSGGNSTSKTPIHLDSSNQFSKLILKNNKIPVDGRKCQWSGSQLRNENGCELIRKFRYQFRSLFSKHGTELETGIFPSSNVCS